MINMLKEKLATVHVIDAVEADALQIFGLRWDVGSGPSYTTLDDALTTGILDVTEVNEAGRVPFLKVANRGDTMVLLMAGEQVIGAKQNRVLNASILVKAGGELAAPVSCVEAGRWGYRSRGFHSQGSSSHAFLRAKMAKHAYLSYRARGIPGSQQDEVWREVSRKLRAMETASPSSALEEVYVNYRERLQRVLSLVRVPDGCCGVAFAFGGQVGAWTSSTGLTRWPDCCPSSCEPMSSTPWKCRMRPGAPAAPKWRHGCGRRVRPISSASTRRGSATTCASRQRQWWAPRWWSNVIRSMWNCSPNLSRANSRRPVKT